MKQQLTNQLKKALTSDSYNAETFFNSLSREEKNNLMELLQQDFPLTTAIKEHNSKDTELLLKFIHCKLSTPLAASDPALYKFLINMQTKFVLSGYSSLQSK